MRLKTILTIGVFIVASVLGLAACGSSDGGNESEVKTLVLSTNKTTITADGNDSVQLTVKYDGTDVTSSAKIFYSDGVEFSGVVFTAEEAGTYVLYATYSDATSNNVTITAKKEDVEEPGFSFKADKTNFYYDGSDVVTFTAKMDGVDVTSETTIINQTTGETLSGNTFSSATNAAVRFEASYDGNSATVVVRPYELIRKVAFMRFTGTWCGPCYTLSKAIDAAREDETIANAFEEVAIHYRADDIMSPRNYSELYVKYSGVTSGYSIPFYMFDFKDSGTGAVASSLFKAKIQEFAAIDFSTAIKATSSVSGTTATVDATIWGLGGGDEYYLGAILLEDGIIAIQTDYGNGYTHNNVMRAMQGGYYGEEISLGTIAADQFVNHSFSFDLTGYQAENCKVFIYVTTKSGNNYYVNNCNVCPVDGSVGYGHALVAAE